MVQAFGVAAPEDLMIGYAHSILIYDLDVTQLLELGERKLAATLPQRHKSQIRYSDKKRVMLFREYATDLYGKHGVSNKVHDLIGDLALDGTLTELGRVDREADAEAGWGAYHWRPNKQADVSMLRGKKSMKPCDFLLILPHRLSRLSVHAWEVTAAPRLGQQSQPEAVWNGLVTGGGCYCTAHSHYIWCMANGIRDGNWQQCFARAVVLESEGISVGVINPATPKSELLAHLIGVRRQLREKKCKESDGCKRWTSRARRALSRSRNASELQRSVKLTP